VHANFVNWEIAVTPKRLSEPSRQLYASLFIFMKFIIFYVQVVWMMYSYHTNSKYYIYTIVYGNIYIFMLVTSGSSHYTNMSILVMNRNMLYFMHNKIKQSIEVIFYSIIQYCINVIEYSSGR